MEAAEVIQTLEGHSSDVMSCDFSDNYLASCSGDKTVRLWLRGPAGKFEEAGFSPLVGHTYGVNCVRFSPFGTLLASCSTDGLVILWNVQDGNRLGEIQHLKGSPVRVCSFSNTSAIFATAGDDEKVVLWEIATKSVIRVLEGHEGMIAALSFTPDSAFLLSCSTADEIMLWDARYGHGKCLFTVLNAHDLGILGCDTSPQYEAVSENGFLSGSYTFATCGNDDLVKIWSVGTGSTKNISLIKDLKGHSANVMACRFSPEGNVLASTGGDRITILWNPKTGEIMQKLEGHQRFVTCCAFANETLLATGSNDRTIIIWSLDKDKLFNSELTTANPKKFLNGDAKGFLSWTIEDVSSWLESLGLEEFTPAFTDHSIDGKELAYLNHENLLTTMKIEGLGQRNKILRGIQFLKNPLWQHVFSDLEDELIPSEFLCPITHEIMRNPVVAADGYSYEKHAIEEWFESGKETSPMTNEIVSQKILFPNYVLVQLIQKYKI